MRKEAQREGLPLPTSGPDQYPRSAVNTFLQRFEGLQIDGRIYRAITRLDGGKFEVFDEEELEEMNETWPRFVTGEVKITTPVGAEETAIAINPVNTNFVIAGSNVRAAARRCGVRPMAARPGARRSACPAIPAATPAWAGRPTA
jgi:hypothetical protein